MQWSRIADDGVNEEDVAYRITVVAHDALFHVAAWSDFCPGTKLAPTTRAVGCMVGFSLSMWQRPRVQRPTS
jgi:hypothetical protein